MSPTSRTVTPRARASRLMVMKACKNTVSIASCESAKGSMRGSRSAESDERRCVGALRSSGRVSGTRTNTSAQNARVVAASPTKSQ
ncbi:MAG: hypothetical protein R3A48_03770 [Polyangiales bacterium]